MPIKPNEMQTIRVYDSPLKDVWEAWANPEKIAKWWGPRGFTLTTKSKNLSAGGKWIYTMHGPDGTGWPNIATYHEVVPLKKLVYDHGGDETRDKLFSVTVNFSEAAGKTTMDMIMSWPTEEEARESAKFIRQAQGDSTWDRLAEFLSEKDVFITTRSFPTDVATMFEMWTNPVQIAKWLPPTGATLKYLTANVKEGGRSHYVMTTTDGTLMYGVASYKKIHPNDLIQYTQSFSDVEGRVQKPPFSNEFPDALLTTVRLTAEGPTQTRVSVRWEVFGETSEKERAFFHGMKAGMTLGWSGSFDKLESLLEAKAQ